MTTLIVGGTGSIGRPLVPLLAQRGEEIVCREANPRTALSPLIDDIREEEGLPQLAL